MGEKKKSTKTVKYLTYFYVHCLQIFEYFQQSCNNRKNINSKFKILHVLLIQGDHKIFFLPWKYLQLKVVNRIKPNFISFFSFFPFFFEIKQYIYSKKLFVFWGIYRQLLSTVCIWNFMSFISRTPSYWKWNTFHMK